MSAWAVRRQMGLPPRTPTGRTSPREPALQNIPIPNPPFKQGDV